jgi:hypothetical protein
MVAPASADDGKGKADRVASAVSSISQSASAVGTIGAPAKLGEGVSVRTDGQPLRVRTGLSTAGRQDIGGRAVYAGSEKQTSTVIQDSGDATQIIKVIEGAQAPTSYSFTFDLAAGARLASTSAGGVVIEQGDEVIGYVEAPWAVDAAGKNVPTSYAVDGNTLVQTVSHQGAAYPVVADPSVSAGRYWYVRYNRSEVRRANATLAASGNAAAITLMCSLLTAVNVVVGAVCGAGLSAVSTSVTGQIRDAQREGKCILHRYNLTPVVLVAWEKYNC